MPTYLAPGVYVEEIPSGVRTIVGVATSITAFVGTAPRGPLDRGVSVASFGDYVRTFGPLGMTSPLSYAVKQYFDNGGSQAIVVRVVKGAKSSTVSLQTGQPAPNDALPLLAASPGAWGDSLSVTVDYETKDPANADLFNLIVKELDANGNTASIETFLNVSLKPEDGRFVARVLEQGSSLVRVEKDNNGVWVVPTTRPQPGTTAAANGADEDPNNPIGDAEIVGDPGKRTGIYALTTVDLFNLLVIPPLAGNPATSGAVYQAALPLCVQRRAMLIVDAPDAAAANLQGQVDALGLNFPNTRNAAVYYPQVVTSVGGGSAAFPSSGAVAGVIARTDATRGVWKAPAGTEAAIAGATDLARPITEAESGALNPIGINCLRSFPVFGRVVWGSRTMAGADRLADDYKYVPVRRLALYIEESLYRGTQWVVFEPNDEPLWGQIRLNVGAFLHGLFRQGAFQGKTPAEAYFVKCDKETTPQADINLGIVNIVVGFAPLKPAEFVVIKIQQIAGQIEI